MHTLVGGHSTERGASILFDRRHTNKAIAPNSMEKKVPKSTEKRTRERRALGGKQQERAETLSY